MMYGKPRKVTAKKRRIPSNESALVIAYTPREKRKPQWLQSPYTQMKTEDIDRPKKKRKTKANPVALVAPARPKKGRGNKRKKEKEVLLDRPDESSEVGSLERAQKVQRTPVLRSRPQAQSPGLLARPVLIAVPAGGNRMASDNSAISAGDRALNDEVDSLTHRRRRRVLEEINTVISGSSSSGLPPPLLFLVKVLRINSVPALRACEASSWAFSYDNEIPILRILIPSLRSGVRSERKDASSLLGKKEKEVLLDRPDESSEVGSLERAQKVQRTPVLRSRPQAQSPGLLARPVLIAVPAGGNRMASDNSAISAGDRALNDEVDSFTHRRRRRVLEEINTVISGSSSSGLPPPLLFLVKAMEASNEYAALMEGRLANLASKEEIAGHLHTIQQLRGELGFEVSWRLIGRWRGSAKQRSRSRRRSLLLQRRRRSLFIAILTR
ncbi:hypothetical protein Bca52824_058435 [Brassica carinata]|uniref:Uncharacterized protein n=1 Tax=Brassica carinata TaxID=52824 RepID=A0A8X7UDM1_BRACI|nr:hypothetical protein Bca52824_058435 [Brassica carinata]